MSDPALTPPTSSPHATRRAPARLWLLLWGAVAITMVTLLVNDAAADTYLWRVTRWVVGDQENYTWAKYSAAHANDTTPLPFYMTRTPPFSSTLPDGKVQARLFQKTEIYWHIFKDFGETFMLALILVALWLLHPYGCRAAAIFAASELLANGISSLIRIIAGRFRPVVADGANHWELFRGFHDGSNLSFPSGHATAAFAMAAVLTYLAPRGKWLYLFIATGTAISRVVMQAHFPSDVIMASALGWTVAWFAAVLLDKLFKGRDHEVAGASPL